MGRGRTRDESNINKRPSSILFTPESDSRLNSLCVVWGKGRPLSRTEVVNRLIMMQDCDSPELIDAQLIEVDAKRRALEAELENVLSKAKHLEKKKSQLVQSRLSEDKEQIMRRGEELSKVVSEVISARDNIWFLQIPTSGDFSKLFKLKNYVERGISETDFVNALESAFSSIKDEEATMKPLELARIAVRRRRGVNGKGPAFRSMTEAQRYLSSTVYRKGIEALGLDPMQVAKVCMEDAHAY